MSYIDTYTFSYESGGNLKFIIERIVPSSRFYKSFKPYKLIPIQNNAFCYFGTKIAHEPLFLPKLYAALTWLTGESDDAYDDYKGSFSFRFELSVKKNGNLSKYAYQIFHYRSYIQVDLYEMVGEDDTRNPEHYVQPNDKYFSDMDINTFSHMFCLNAIELMEKAKHIPQPFFKCSDSNLLLFGYDDEDGYFYEDYISGKNEENAKNAEAYMNDAEEYEKAKELMKLSYGNSEKKIVRNHRLANLKGILPKPDTVLTIDEMNDVVKKDE